jgi:formylmethanofuran dehydrogenase subunit A
MTRTAAANLLGLYDRGHLTPGGIADIAVYTPQDNKEAMFDRATLVFKNGRLVVRDGEVVERIRGTAQMIYPSYDPGIKRTIKNHFDRFYSLSLENFTIKDVDFVQRDQERFVVHDCRG